MKVQKTQETMLGSCVFLNKFLIFRFFIDEYKVFSILKHRKKVTYERTRTTSRME